ncbi:MAG: hypothetical protein J3Q66DRAFT_357249 [Benniella sp.]|nr:MAG: hypothetical protein J3Q66DRAFT_357249 [Benniella sp.]
MNLRWPSWSGSLSTLWRHCIKLRWHIIHTAPALDTHCAREDRLVLGYIVHIERAHPNRYYTARRPLCALTTPADCACRIDHIVTRQKGQHHSKQELFAICSSLGSCAPLCCNSTELVLHTPIPAREFMATNRRSIPQHDSSTRRRIHTTPQHTRTRIRTRTAQRLTKGCFHTDCYPPILLSCVRKREKQMHELNAVAWKQDMIQATYMNTIQVYHTHTHTHTMCIPNNNNNNTF